MLNIAISDLLISVFGIPMAFIAAIYKEWVWVFNHTLCVNYGFFMATSGN